jgi:hypothetical protein
MTKGNQPDSATYHAFFWFFADQSHLFIAGPHQRAELRIPKIAWARRDSPKIFFQPEERSKRFAVADFSPSRHLEDLWKRHEMHGNTFIILWLSLSLGQSDRQEYVHGLVEKPWAGIETERAPPLAGGIAGFFEQFSLGGGKPLLAGINVPGGKLPHDLVGGVPVLPLKKQFRNAPGIVNRKNDDRAGMTDDFALGRDAVRFFNFIGDNVKDAAAKNDFRCKCTSGLYARGHANNIHLGAVLSRQHSAFSRIQPNVTYFRILSNCLRSDKPSPEGRSKVAHRWNAVEPWETVEKWNLSPGGAAQF